MQTTIEHRPYLKGKLEVHITKNPAGDIVAETFTFASLTHVLGLPLSTLEGRYNRSNARVHKITLRTGAGRPARGFPLALLEPVIQALGTTNARFNVPASASPARPIGNTPPLEPVIIGGEHYYTIPALADHYAVTPPTVRARIKSSGLTSRLVDIGSTAKGGRPRMAFKQDDLPDIHLAMTAGISFATDEATAIARAAPAAVVGDAAPAPIYKEPDPITQALQTHTPKPPRNPATPPSPGDLDWNTLVSEIDGMVSPSE